MAKTELTWPAWFSSPDGSKTAIFASADGVPKGWTSGAEKLTVESEEKPATKKAAAKNHDL